MRTSLSLRLLIAASVSTVIALLATALVLNYLFRTYFEERIHAELESYMILLTGQVELDANGNLEVSDLADPRFSEPLSGYYWQVQLENQPPILSQSLWSEPLHPKRPERRGEIAFSSVEMPDGGGFLTGSWLITLQHNSADRELFLVVAVDQAQFESPILAFSRNVSISMGVLGAFLVIASWFQVQVGLRPLENVRAEVVRVRGRPGSRLSEDHPAELEPLVNEVNALLDHQDSTIEDARARASTLAHGLKTPLTIMRGLSQELRKADQQTIPTEIDSQVDNMQHLVERELARTRDLLSARDIWCSAGPVVEKIVQAFRRRVGSEAIRWQVDITGDAICPFDEYALTELLGNLVDNASKWTRDEIHIHVEGTRDGGQITVSDNGPGISEVEIGAVLRRGKKLDDSISGQGLGLAIVSDMVKQRDASFQLLNRSGGGLQAKVSW